MRFALLTVMALTVLASAQDAPITTNGTPWVVAVLNTTNSLGVVGTTNFTVATLTVPISSSISASSALLAKVAGYAVVAQAQEVPVYSGTPLADQRSSAIAAFNATGDTNALAKFINTAKGAVPDNK